MAPPPGGKVRAARGAPVYWEGVQEKGTFFLSIIFHLPRRRARHGTTFGNIVHIAKRRTRFSTCISPINIVRSNLFVRGEFFLFFFWLLFGLGGKEKGKGRTGSTCKYL